ncbi:SDR family oxidoreductase [Mycolicibacterium goodii]|uniref:SDR family NAD(P)-dependent oxidoreductase n=1 Tax=Mycolicibacterium goodii TaxID=134601 RepID=UPI001BDBEDEE|nr:SDR family oxidoreductase [Mycolicibacterium goodii]MBU8807491.1 SDR family oxidoreductase [Mycolicibacterium goodii]MBU8814428.1 SDR family oxidoreductase [Mycolicibacterium goodii]ULN47664.1 SDR family oxidoreductase [Mycolicibacterium goodii]
MRLVGKIALITGAANGMGCATAETFSREGAVVVIADVDDEEGSRVTKQIRTAGGTADYIHLDVTDETAWTVAIDAVLGRHERLDILVNNAGISGTFDPDLTSTEFFDRLIAVNARGVFLGMKHGAAAMKPTGGGSIVNLSSISAHIGQLGVHLGYGASKAAVKAMTTTAAVHYAGDGIRVNAVAPGMLPPMRTSRGSADPAWRAKQIDGVPLRREGKVQEVADAVLFLASDEASYVTGTELMVDGGLTAV